MFKIISELERRPSGFDFLECFRLSSHFPTLADDSAGTSLVHGLIGINLDMADAYAQGDGIATEEI
jgi:hypothetical protein